MFMIGCNTQFISSKLYFHRNYRKYSTLVYLFKIFKMLKIFKCFMCITFFFFNLKRKESFGEECQIINKKTTTKLKISPVCNS